jgi:prepilin-type N-terminal cleavage/methylation domain-containing protein
MFHHRRKRAGVTLVEMLLALAVLGIMALSLGALASTVHSSNNYSQTRGEAIQHARVACERIERALHAAYATADYPGFAAVATTVGSYSYPDLLIVWRPDGAPANAAGPPLMKELVFFTFDPSAPQRLLEITRPTDSRAAPAPTNLTQWAIEIANLHTSNSSVKVQLTDLLRTGDAGSAGTQMRGAIRFETRLRPSAAEWASFQSGTLNWADLSWAQSVYSADTGLRQAWCSYELQLVPRDKARSGADSAAHALPAFGSGAIYYTLSR